MNSKSKRSPVFKVERIPRLGKRIPWNEEHDKHLLRLVNLNDGRNWKNIASGMQAAFQNDGLTAKKCRERWSNCADPAVSKGSLSKAEELMLLACHEKYGNKWAMIAQQLPKRNCSKIKNTFSSLIKKVSRKIGLNVCEDFVTPLVFVQEFYMAMVVYDLVTVKGDHKEVCRIASEHISKYIESRNVGLEQCLKYAAMLSKVFIGCYGNEFQTLNSVSDISDMRAFISKLFAIVRSRYEANTLKNDSSILEIIQSSLLDDMGLKCLEVPKADEVLSNNEPFIPADVAGEDFGVTEYFEEPAAEEMSLEPAFHFSSPEFQSFPEPHYSLDEISPCVQTRKESDEENFMFNTPFQTSFGEGPIRSYLDE